MYEEFFNGLRRKVYGIGIGNNCCSSAFASILHPSTVSLHVHPCPFTRLIKQVIADRIIVTQKHASPYSSNREKIISIPVRSNKITIPATTIIETNHHVLSCHRYISKNIILAI